MPYKNYVFIASSLDGYIADKDGGIEWLNAIPNPENIDMGYGKFIERTDALIMGRNTFEKVLSFNVPWPYEKPVFVMSKTLKSLPDELKGKAEIVNGSVDEVLKQIHGLGYTNLYIDGGNLIQSFLKKDGIDEMVITTIPVLLGGGFSLFGELPNSLDFELVKSEIFLKAIVQNTFRRKRKDSNQLNQYG